MSFKQCSGCQATVDVSKAYCPECGAPMDEEQKRSGSSEYDSLMKTQQLSQTTQFKLAEYFNQSPGFAPLPKDSGKSNEGENERKSVMLNLQPLTPPPVAAPKQPEIEVNSIADNSSKSKKTFYIVGGTILLFFSLALITLIILGFLYWNYLK